jgi:predicted dehydrogenase
VTTEHFYDTLVAVVTFESGAIASVTGVCPVDYGYDARVEVTCTAGMVEVGRPGPGGLATTAAGTGRRCEAVYPSWRNRFADAYVREMVEFLEAIDGGPIRVGAAEGTRAVALAVAGTVSMLEGRSVPVAEVNDPAVIPWWQTAAGGVRGG